MRLIGMLDSPYVRRVAISLSLLDLGYEHEPLSVFRDFDAFGSINPVVKAPTLVTRDGAVLMDSTLILEFAERIAPDGSSLQPKDEATFVRSQGIIGLALAACEKTVQIVYERNLRPAEKQHEPWVARVTGQLMAAYRQLEHLMISNGAWLCGERPMQADVTTAVAWSFTQSVLPELIAVEAYPGLREHAEYAELLPAFKSTACS